MYGNDVPIINNASQSSITSWEGAVPSRPIPPVVLRELCRNVFDLKRGPGGAAPHQDGNLLAAIQNFCSSFKVRCIGHHGSLSVGMRSVVRHITLGTLPVFDLHFLNVHRESQVRYGAIRKRRATGEIH